MSVGVFLRASGQDVDLDDMSKLVFDWADVENGLAGQIRYGGQIPVSVLEHSVITGRIAALIVADPVLFQIATGIVAAHAPAYGPRIVQEAYLHDVGETYLPDVIRPIKDQIEQWPGWEAAADTFVRRSLGLRDTDAIIDRAVRVCDYLAVPVETHRHVDPSSWACRFVPRTTDLLTARCHVDYDDARTLLREIQRRIALPRRDANPHDLVWELRRAAEVAGAL